MSELKREALMKAGQELAAILLPAEPTPEPTPATPAPAAASAPAAEPAAPAPAVEDQLPTDQELEAWRDKLPPAQWKMVKAERDRVLAAREAHAEAVALAAEQLRREIPDYDDPHRVEALLG